MNSQDFPIGPAALDSIFCYLTSPFIDRIDFEWQCSIHVYSSVVLVISNGEGRLWENRRCCVAKRATELLALNNSQRTPTNIISIWFIYFWFACSTNNLRINCRLFIFLELYIHHRTCYHTHIKTKLRYLTKSLWSYMDCSANGTASKRVCFCVLSIEPNHFG